MTDLGESLAQIYKSWDGSPARCGLEFALAPTHEARLEAVRKAIDFILSEFVQTRQNRQGRGEDELTVDVVGGLVHMGFQATHDTQIGGHADAVVQGREGFLWLGEAKVHSSYDWLLDGFIQLENYLPGTQGQDAGDILIYLYGQNAVAVMTEWLRYLAEQRTDVHVVDGEGQSLTRFTQHAHRASGRPLNFRHRIAPLFWQRLKTAKKR